MRIARTEAAEEDLVGIWLYIGERDPFAADAILEKVDRRPQMLAEFPYAGVAREDIGPGIRQLVEGNYILLYRVIGDHVEILRVLNARQRITSDVIGA